MVYFFACPDDFGIPASYHCATSVANLFCYCFFLVKRNNNHYVHRYHFLHLLLCFVIKHIAPTELIKFCYSMSLIQVRPIGPTIEQLSRTDRSDPPHASTISPPAYPPTSYKNHSVQSNYHAFLFQRSHLFATQ